MNAEQKLERLQRELRPVYGRHTDSVISMVGLEPHAAVVEALKQRDLTEAEAAHKLHLKFSRHGENKCSYCPSSHAAFLYAVRPHVGWLAKPLKPPKVRKLEVKLLPRFPTFDSLSPPGEIRKVKANATDIGSAQIRYEGHHGNRTMFVIYLQQHTKTMPSGQARKFEGWKNTFMEELEREARRFGARRIMFSTGSEHIVNNVNARPIHHEVLETYGRLPMQHGYKLETSEKFSQKLWWMKELS